MRCFICGQRATRILRCPLCGFLAAYLCDGFVCRPALWESPGSVVSLMGMACESCGGRLAERPLPRKRFVGPPRPLFPTTALEAVHYFDGKRIVLITNVFGDGLGDMGQGLKLAHLLSDAGANVAFVPCCLKKDEAAVNRMIGGGGTLRTLLKVATREKRSEYNKVPHIDMDLYGEHTDVKDLIDDAHIVLSFPTALPIKFSHDAFWSNVTSVEECVEKGDHVLGFGVANTARQERRPRLGVVLSAMGPVDEWNLGQMQDVDLKGLLLGGQQQEEWRCGGVFSVGYLKVPESSPNLFASIGQSQSSPPVSTSLSSASRGGGIGMGRGASSSRLVTRPASATSVSGASTQLTPMAEPSMMGRPSRGPSRGASSSPGSSMLNKLHTVQRATSSGRNSFMDNFIKLQCLSAPAGKAITLYCPNFDPRASGLGLRSTANRGEYTRFEGLVFDRLVAVVCGNCAQNEFLMLLNEAALSGEIHRRPILIGAPGEGTLSEVLSIQSVSQAVFPIYSPRYPYQHTNLLRLADESQCPSLRALLERIMSLHHLGDRDLLKLLTEIDALQREMLDAQLLVHRHWNFFNLLFLRLTRRR